MLLERLKIKLSLLINMTHLARITVDKMKVNISRSANLKVLYRSIIISYIHPNKQSLRISGHGWLKQCT